MKPLQILRALSLTTALAVAAAPASYGEGAQRITSTGKAFAKLGPPSAGIPRFAEVCPGISRGGDPGEAGIRYLHDHGFKTVVSFLADKEESLQVVRSGMRWVHIPMHSWYFSADPPTPSQVHQFLAVVQDTTQYPVFMHCKAGKDRTGAMTAIYRIEACGWTKDEAMEEMNSFGFAGRYKGLRQFVKGYTRTSTALAMAGPQATPPTQTIRAMQASTAPQDSTIAGATPAPTAATEASSPSSR